MMGVKNRTGHPITKSTSISSLLLFYLFTIWLGVHGAISFLAIMLSTLVPIFLVQVEVELTLANTCLDHSVSGGKVWSSSMRCMYICSF